MAIGGCGADSASVGCDRDDHEHQEAGEDELVGERRPGTDGWDGRSQVGGSPIPREAQHDRASDGAEELGGDVRGGVAEREVPGRREREGDGGVDVRAGEMTGGIDHREDDQAEHGGDPDCAERLTALAVHDDCSAAGEHQCERRDALREGATRKPRPRQEAQRRGSGRERRSRRG